MTELHPVLFDLVPSVARTIARRYGGYVEFDDVKQECFSWCITRTEYIDEQLNETNPEMRKHNEQRIAWQMRRVAERYARKEKAAKSGYQVGDETYYDKATLGQLLPYVIASVIDGTILEQAQDMIRDGQPKGSSSPAEGGNILATLIDIKKAYLTIEQEHRDILTWRYHESLTLAQIAELLECAVSTADRRCSNALRKISDELGGQSPWR